MTVELLRELRGRVLSVVPKHDMLAGQAARLRELAGSVRVDGRTDAEIKAAIVAAILAGDEVPAEPELELVAAAERTRRAQLRESLYRTALSAVQAELEHVIRMHAAAAFEVLDDEVRSITDAVRALGPMPADADAAIRAGSAAAWSLLVELVERFTIVRAVWAETWQKVGGGHGTFGSLIWLRPEIVLVFDPPVADRLTQSWTRVMTGEYSPDGAWPGYQPEASGPWPVDDADRPAWLCWAAGVDGLWAPSPAQLTTALREITDAIQRAEQDRATDTPAPPEKDPHKIRALLDKHQRIAARDAAWT